MSVPRMPHAARATRTRLGAEVALVLLTLVLVAACSSSPGGGGGTRLLHYQRTWPDGRVEQQTIYADGRIEMKHGEMLERLTIPAEDVARIQAALEQPIPTGSPADTPRRRLELADGTIIEAPTPVPGSVTELLEQLLTTHSLA